MRVALGIEYNGYYFHGWQCQENIATVQGSLSIALSKIANEPITLQCAGRTDAGVHAVGQVVHFDTLADRPLRAWILGTNKELSPYISVKWAKIVDEQFHARFSATARRYHYLIYNHLSRPAVLLHQVTWYYDVLNIQTMQEAATYLIGEHDFSSFRSSECESRTPMRHIKQIQIHRFNDFISIQIEANAFLHHMVRNIVGVLMRIGAGFQEPEWMETVLKAKDRTQAAATAPAAGLYLQSVQYPDKYALPVPSLPAIPAQMGIHFYLYT